MAFVAPNITITGLVLVVSGVRRTYKIGLDYPVFRTFRTSIDNISGKRLQTL